MRRLAQRPATVPVLLLLAGLILRLGWIGVHAANTRLGEASNTAVAVATKGSFADAFFVGQGPTAHLMPVSPLIAGLLLRLSGVGSPASNYLLAAWSLAQVGLSYVLLSCLFGKLGCPRPVRMVALALLCLFPVLAGPETYGFRFWEGALAVICGVTTLLLIAGADARPEPSAARQATIGGTAAATFFVSPPMGLGIYCAVTLWARDALPAARRLGFGLRTGAIALAVIAPWTMRNAYTMHRFIPLRDNFGLEFAIANYPGAVDPPDPTAAWLARMDAIHPSLNPHLWPRVKGAGEADYARALAHQTIDWARRHPVDFARLTLRHLATYYFPGPRQFLGRAPHPAAPIALARAIDMALVSALGLAGAVVGAIRRDRRYRYLLAAVVVPALPYALVEPVPRYTYLVYGLLTFLAVDFAAWSIRAVRDRRVRGAETGRP